MARPSPLTYLPLWERALAAEIGIAVPVTGIERNYFLSTLYEARKQSKDLRLEALMVFQPAPPYGNELWICKREVELTE